MIPPGFINHDRLDNPRTEWRRLARNITYKYKWSTFQQTMCVYPKSYLFFQHLALNKIPRHHRRVHKGTLLGCHFVWGVRLFQRVGGATSNDPDLKIWFQECCQTNRIIRAYTGYPSLKANWNKDINIRIHELLDAWETPSSNGSPAPHWIGNISIGNMDTPSPLLLSLPPFTTG